MSYFQNVMNELIPTFGSLHQSLEGCIEYFKKGLAHTDPDATTMLPSYVIHLPTGNETGSYYAIDFGGTNLRILRVELQGGRKVHSLSSASPIPESVKTGSGDHMFDWVAEQVSKFIQDLESKGISPWDNEGEMKVGFTFSFAIKQTSINRGTLLTWGKGFSASGVVGKDVVLLLEKSLERKNLAQVKVVALVNDTVGTLMAHAYKHPTVGVSVILGTGTNAAYVEQVKNIGKWPTDEKLSSSISSMVINTEWSFFHEDLPKTKYDEKLHELTQENLQIYEKMISGYFLGELGRQIVLDLVHHGELFAGVSWESPVQSTPFILDARVFSQLAGSTTDLQVESILKKEFHIPSPTKSDCERMQHLGRVLGKRSGYLSAIGLAGLLKMTHLDQAACGVAIDGTLFEQYPFYREHLEEALEELLGKTSFKNISISLSKDGSGLGAAVIAALHH